jgi:AraC-like DNA-binding protein
MSDDLSFTTDCAPAAESFDAWREFSLGALGVLSEPLDRAPTGFKAKVSARVKGPLGFFRYQTHGTHLIRGAPQIARRTWNAYMIHRERSGGARYTNPLKSLQTQPGALGVAAIDMPWEGWAGGHFDHDVLIVPMALLDPHLPAMQRPVFTTIARPVGFGALAVDYFDSLMGQWEELDDAEMGAAAGILCRLFGVALGVRADSAPEAVTAGRLESAKRHVESRLADPRLDAASAAAALRISERTLEGVFAEAGLSFAAYVRRRRLQQCREALFVTPARSIADIAFAWGFNSLSSFYRGFVAEFGMSPGELREQRARSGPATEPGAPPRAARKK